MPKASRSAFQRSSECSGALASRIKKTLVAGEKRKSCVRRARDEWVKYRLPAMREVPEQLVFIEETSVKTNLTRL